MTKLPLYKYNPSHASHMKTKHLTLLSPPIHLSIFILKENLEVNSWLEIQQIQIELPTLIFHRYFAVIFTNRTFFITKIIGIYWQKQSIVIYWGNPRRNIKNKKKQVMRWRVSFCGQFYQWNYSRIQTGMSVQWCVKNTDNISDEVTNKIIL